ncbi:hypothetical protein [Arthrobacter pigmenti]
MGALLALGSALFYGIADFAGGLLSRRADPTAIALLFFPGWGSPLPSRRCG